MYLFLFSCVCFFCNNSLETFMIWFIYCLFIFSNSWGYLGLWFTFYLFFSSGFQGRFASFSNSGVNVRYGSTGTWIAGFTRRMATSISTATRMVGMQITLVFTGSNTLNNNLNCVNCKWKMLTTFRSVKFLWSGVIGTKNVDVCKPEVFLPWLFPNITMLAKGRRGQQSEWNFSPYQKGWRQITNSSVNKAY